MSDFEIQIDMPLVTDERMKELYKTCLEHRVALMKERDELQEENEKLQEQIKTMEEEKEELESKVEQYSDDADRCLEAEEENEELKEEVIAERKKVIAAEEKNHFDNEMWRAESVYLESDSAKAYPEQFNDFLKEEFDEEMYKKMYEAFELKELLEPEDESEEDDQYQSICDHEGCEQQMHIHCAIQIVTDKLTGEERTVCNQCYQEEYQSNEDWKKNDEEEDPEEE